MARFKLSNYLSTKQPDAGTVAYMAPECFQENTITPKAVGALFGKYSPLHVPQCWSPYPTPTYVDARLALLRSACMAIMRCASCSCTDYTNNMRCT